MVSAFSYQPPSFEEAQKLTERRSSMFDGLIKQNGPKFLKARTGSNTIRILPPTWENAKHYSYEIKIHQEIGPNRQQYLCLKENEAAPEHDCPLCAEMYSTKISEKEKEKLRPTTRNVIYLIDRNNPHLGPLIWMLSTKRDTEILSQSIIKRTQKYLPIAHPVDGYDVDFDREGAGLNTEYRGFQVSRESTPLSEDENQMMEWINYIEANPIPSILQFYSAARIREVYYGMAREDEDESKTTTPSRDAVATDNGHVGPEEPPFDTDKPAPRRRPSLGDPETSTTHEDVREALRRRLANR